MNGREIILLLHTIFKYHHNPRGDAPSILEITRNTRKRHRSLCFSGPAKRPHHTARREHLRLAYRLHCVCSCLRSTGRGKTSYVSISHSNRLPAFFYCHVVRQCG